jgi:hypothetical protein
MRRIALTFLTIVLTLFAGCAGSGPKDVVESPTTSAPTATVTAELGSISGKVVDDEMQPVAGAQVAIIKEDLETVSDAGGLFTFNELLPGTYDVIAQKLGFEQAARRADVVAGEVTEVTLSLAALVVSAEPYYASVPKVTLIQAGNAYTEFAFQQANVSALNGITCELCVYIVHYPAKPAAVMAEAHWTCGQCNQVLNNEVWYKVHSEWTTGAQLDGTVIINTYFSNREQVLYDAEDTKAAQKTKNGALLVHLGADLEGLSLQHKVETIHSFAYNVDEFPEGFTALPPA